MKNKKGVSIIVAYVLLVVIALSLSGLVYYWLKAQLPKETEKCPDDISLIISEYNCENKNINLTLTNKGLFNIKGFIARIAKTEQELPIYPLKYQDKNEVFLENELKPNEKFNILFSYSEYSTIAKIEIQPIYFKETYIFCDKAVITQNVENCT